MVSQPLSLSAHQHTVPHRKCRCQIPTSLAERYARPHAARDAERTATHAGIHCALFRASSFVWTAQQTKRPCRRWRRSAPRPGQRDTHARRERAGPGAGV